jgi:hypothetical protein
MITTQITKSAETGETSKTTTESSCCENPSLNSYPSEDPIVDICFQCGKWNWISY